MHILNRDNFDPRFNVVVKAYERQRNGSQLLVARRETHNVMTNTGRNWLVQRLGSTDYTVNTPVVTTVLKYVGLGCGGALQTAPGFLHAQTELASVIALEDPVGFSKTGDVWTYGKTCVNQVLNSTYFPGTGRTVFQCFVLETEVSFAANRAKGSNTLVGTEVPVSEAGLYLSDALPTYNDVSLVGGNPLNANSLACYDLFDPIVVTPNVLLAVEWELRVS